jgi:hypothetical protein
MLETPSISQYESQKDRDNLVIADNQQGRPMELEPSTTIRTAPAKQWKTRNRRGYEYHEDLKRWVRIITNAKAFCTGCSEFKSLGEFSTVKGKPYHYCKECTRYNKAASRYGISKEMARKLYSKTTCDCCGGVFEKQSHQHIHHVGNTVKGLVCLPCNHMLRDTSNEHLQRLKCCVRFIEQDEDRV